MMEPTNTVHDANEARPVVTAAGTGEQRMAHTGPYTVLLTTALTGGRYTLTENELPAGTYHEPHVHPTPETFYVISGSFTFFIDGVTYEAPAGTTAFVPPNVPHGYLAGPQGGRKLNITP
jgi:quercetin dioxygenase-like cupin family protein